MQYQCNTKVCWGTIVGVALRSKVEACYDGCSQKTIALTNWHRKNIRFVHCIGARKHHMPKWEQQSELLKHAQCATAIV